MPRLSPRRLFMSFAVVAMTILLLFNVWHSDQWMQLGYTVDNSNNHYVHNSFRSLNQRDENSPVTNVSILVHHSNTSAVTILPAVRPVSTTRKMHPGTTTRGRLWFMTEGWVRPEPERFNRSKKQQRTIPLWAQEDPGDRIVEQLMYVPPVMPPGQQQSNASLKTILLFNGINNWAPLKAGREVFFKDKCPVNTCTITANRDDFPHADAVLFKDHFNEPQSRRPRDQVWILYLLECPLHTQAFNHRNVFNWTATYRHDSDIVAPYEKFVLFDPAVQALPPKKNYAVNKTKKVAWFVSNCGARNNRLQYARQLAHYIEVDIYGACGSKVCPRSQHSKCFEMLSQDYKFYLSFENSNCKDYITEKFFVNGLGHDVVPIVMGARREDYQRAAPYHSFIAVDDFDSPKSLADYLHKLDNNDTLYNQYFQWKNTGEFVNTHFWCRMCALLHATTPPKVYDDIDVWWRAHGTCTSGSWRHGG